MSDDLVGSPAEDRAVVNTARDIVPNNAGVNFGGGFGRCHRTDVDDGPYEARGVANTGNVGPEIFWRHRRRLNCTTC